MTEQPEVPVRVVVCAANYYEMPNGQEPLIICSPRHFDNTMHRVILEVKGIRSAKPPIQGFVDQWGVFMNRADALDVATAAGQIDVRRPKTPPSYKLFSEDLY